MSNLTVGEKRKLLEEKAAALCGRRVPFSRRLERWLDGEDVAFYPTPPIKLAWGITLYGAGTALGLAGAYTLVRYAAFLATLLWDCGFAVVLACIASAVLGWLATTWGYERLFRRMRKCGLMKFDWAAASQYQNGLDILESRGFEPEDGERLP